MSDESVRVGFGLGAALPGWHLQMAYSRAMSSRQRWKTSHNSKMTQNKPS
jgi:hypothetical protein